MTIESKSPGHNHVTTAIYSMGTHNSTPKYTYQVLRNTKKNNRKGHIFLLNLILVLGVKTNTEQYLSIISYKASVPGQVGE